MTRRCHQHWPQVPGLLPGKSFTAATGALNNFRLIFSVPFLSKSLKYLTSRMHIVTINGSIFPHSIRVCLEAPLHHPHAPP